MCALIILIVTGVMALLFKYAFDKSILKPDLTLKILSVSLCVLGIFRYFLSDSFVENVNFGEDVLQSILRWTYHIGYAVIPMAVFFSSRLFRNIAIYFSLPVAIICAVFSESTVAYFLAEGAGGFYITPWLRYAFYALELVIAIVTPLLLKIESKHKLDFKKKKEIFTFLGTLPLIMLQMIPSYIPRTIFPALDVTTGMFGELHILWLVALVIEIVSLHYIFRNRTNEDKNLLLVFLVIAQVMHTTSPMIRGFTYSRLPLQLCNIAAFFYLYMIIKKDKKVFDFCFLANLVGAAIAMVLTDFSSEALSFWNIHYIYEHSFVVIVPALCTTLGIFPRLDKSSVKNMIKYFSVYFAFIFVFGTIINATDATPDNFLVNHFYMFNPQVAVDYLPFVGFTGAIHWEFGPFEIYPILVLTIFVVFVSLNCIFYLLTRGVYTLLDTVRAKTHPKELVLQTK